MGKQEVLLSLMNISVTIVFPRTNLRKKYRFYFLPFKALRTEVKLPILFKFSMRKLPNLFVF